MNLVIIDVDGVFNPYPWTTHEVLFDDGPRKVRGLSHEKLMHLRTVLHGVGEPYHLVSVSPFPEDELRAGCEKALMHLDEVVYVEGEGRAQYVRRMVDSNEYTRVVVIDDEDKDLDYLRFVPEHFVHVDNKHGFTVDDSANVWRILQGQKLVEVQLANAMRRIWKQDAYIKRLTEKKEC